MNASTSVDSSGTSALSGERNGMLEGFTELAGRVLLALLFVLSGVGKLGTYGATADYMSAMGVPGALLPVVIATEIIGAVAIIIGWKTRVVAFLLAGLSLLLSTRIFHRNLVDQIQMIMFFKNIAIAGGFLLLVANGAGRLSIDRRSGKYGSR